MNSIFHTPLPPTGPGAVLSNRRSWVIVGLLTLAAFINYLDRASLSVALPLISSELGLGPATKGLLLSAFFWSYSAMQIPTGWCVNRLNLRWVYVVAFALWSLSCGLTGFATTLGMLLVLRAALGVGEAIHLPGGVRIVRSLFRPAERGLPTGLFDAGTRFGVALGATLIAWLIVRYGWRGMFLFLGFTALFWLIPWVIVFPARLPSPSRLLPPLCTAAVSRLPITETCSRCV